MEECAAGRVVVVRSLSRFRLVIAVALAILAGYIDGIAFVYLGGYFVSFMSGNTTQSGVELAGGDLAAAGFGFLVILGFVLGVMGGTIVSSPGRDRGGIILVGVALSRLFCSYFGSRNDQTLGPDPARDRATGGVKEDEKLEI